MKTPTVKTEQLEIFGEYSINNAANKDREFPGKFPANQPITDDLIQEVKEINIKTLIEKETGLGFDRNHKLQYCPFCNSGNHPTPSSDSAFSVNLKENYFNCFSCNESGSPIDFIIKLKNLDLSSAISHLIGNYLNVSSIPATSKHEPKSIASIISAVKKNPNKLAATFLQDRKIDVSRLPSNSFNYNQYMKSISFLDSDEKLLNNRRIKPTLRRKYHNQGQLKGAIYNNLFSNISEQVYITEGVINAMSLYMCNLSVLATFGTGNKFDDLQKLMPYLKGKKVIIAFDNDAAGKKYTDEFVNLFSSNNTATINLQQLIFPPGIDANDLLIEDKLEAYIDNSDNYKSLRFIKTNEIKKSELGIEDFWRIGQNGKVVIKHKKLIDFLAEGGFRLYRLKKPGDYKIVRVQNRIVSEVSRIELKKYTESKLDDRDNILESIVRGSSTYFGCNHIDFLPDLENNFHQDTKKQCYVYYHNGFVEITSDNINFKEYSDLPNLIWENQINHRDLYLITDKQKSENFMFNEFLLNVCDKDPDRLISLKSILGYCLHRYKINPKAVLFLDQGIGDSPEGRSGKTLTCTALKYVRNYTEIDGKNFNPENRFKYQNASIETQILCFNDVGIGKRLFNIEFLFTAISEGVTVEQKNKSSFLIEPKIMLTSNRSIIVEGGSAKDRVVEFEFSDHYHLNHHPIDDFGIMFFTDWSESDWQLFDSIMLQCIQIFLKNGIINPKVINLNRKKVFDFTTQNNDFMDFIEEELAPDTKYDKTIIFEKFKELYPDYSDLKQNTFTKWIKHFVSSYDLNYSQSKSNGRQFFSYSEK